MEALPSQNQTNRSVELGRVGQPVAQRDQTNPVLSDSQVRGERRLGNSILPGATKRSFVKLVPKLGFGNEQDQGEHFLRWTFESGQFLHCASYANSSIGRPNSLERKVLM